MSTDKKAKDFSTFIVYPTDYKPISRIQDYICYNSKKSTFLLTNPYYDIPETNPKYIYKHPSDITIDDAKTSSTNTSDTTSKVSEPAVIEKSIFDIDDLSLDFGITEPATTTVKYGGAMIKPKTYSTAKFKDTAAPPTLDSIISEQFVKLLSPRLVFNDASTETVKNKFTIAYGVLDEHHRLTKKEYVLRAPFEYSTFQKKSIKCNLSPIDIHKIDMYLTLLEYQSIYVSELIQLALLFQLDLKALVNNNYSSVDAAVANNEFITIIVNEVNRKLSKIDSKLDHIKISPDYISSFINPPCYKRTEKDIIRATAVSDIEHTFRTPLEQVAKSITALKYSTDKEIKTLAKRLFIDSISYNSTFKLSLKEFQHMWITFYGISEKKHVNLIPNNKLVIYPKVNEISGTTFTGKWLSLPVIFNTNTSKFPTLRHISAEKLEPVSAVTVAEMFRIDLESPEYYNNRKYYFSEGCIYLTPRFYLGYGSNWNPGMQWIVDKYILVKSVGNRSSSRIYNDIDTISGLFEESPKVKSLK